MKQRLFVGGALMLALLPLAMPADALQRREKEAAPPAATLSKEERAALLPVEEAMTAKDYAKAAAALQASASVVQGADARYIHGNNEFELGRATNSFQHVAVGLENMIASGKAAPASLPTMYRNLALAYGNLKQADRQDAALTKYLELVPNDTAGLVDLGRLRMDQKRPADAFSLLDRAIAAEKAAGRAATENIYRVALGQAQAAGLKAESDRIGRELVAAYPTGRNWKALLAGIRASAAADRELNLDLFRLLRASKALTDANDYNQFVSLLSDRGYPAEAKAVLDEGMTGQVVQRTPTVTAMIARFGERANASKATLAADDRSALAEATGASALLRGNVHFGLGDYARAAELYKAALQKGGVDANVANTRLGMALALAGRKAEAEAALKAVSGARAELASYLLIWLSKSA